MDQPAIKQTKRLLGGQDPSDVAGWGHQVDDTFPGISRMHFQVHDDTSGQAHCGPKESRISKCEDNLCLLESVKHFYGKIVTDEGRRMDFPAIDYSKAEQGVKFNDVDAVKMLINLIGDMHQPLHVGFASDDNGRTTQLKFKGKTISLYEMWDSVISETVREQESSFWLGGWTHVRSVMGQFNKDKELWKKEGAFKAFETWMEETVQLACSTAYVHPSTKKKLVGPDAPQGPVEISMQDYQTWKRVWLNQILVAGERTAIVLNDILDAREAAKLKEGSNVQTKADEVKKKEEAEWEKERQEMRKNERRSASTPYQGPMFVPQVIFKNFMIALVTVPLYLLFVEKGLNPQTWYNLLMEWLEADKAQQGGSAAAAVGTGARKGL